MRAFHLAEDDELGLLAVVGSDTVGDVQIVARGGEPATLEHVAPAWSQVSFGELWRRLPGPRTTSALPGVQPKMSAGSRSLQGGVVGQVILKFPLEGWHGVLRNEATFMARARDVGLTAAATEIVTDAEGASALAVTRFDRWVDADGALRRQAQEDASQVLGLRPGQKYDPDARTVIAALASRCAAPRLAARDLFHQLVYSYAVGNNDVHAKNLSIRQEVAGLWTVTPVYDVLHTWPYEGDHRFVPAVRPDGLRDAVSMRWWLDLAADIDLPEKAARRILAQVAAKGAVLADADGIDLPDRQRRDLRRVVRRRTRDLTDR